MKIDLVWSFSNLLGGTNEQTQYFVDIDIVPAFLNLLKLSNNYLLSEQILWGISNLCNDTEELANELIENKWIDILISICEKHIEITTSPKLANIIIWGLRGIIDNKLLEVQERLKLLPLIM
jgi:hypothetical protein